ncbi:MAG TPA: 50S ribosomal protein L4 [Terrimicrobium sp.]|jgi:large subunit ribosomal protein L4
MSATIFTAEEARKANIELITEPEKGRQAVHDVVVALRANRRRGTASTKTKADVRLSGAKPWRQKGTGRARAGYKSSPVWVGGGVAFGPHPRDYSKKVPKKVKTLAFRKALSERVLAGDVLLVEDFKVNEAKTKQFLTLVADTAGNARKMLIVGTGFDEKTYLAARNVRDTLLARAAEVNTEQLLAFDKVIVTRDALATLSERLA